MNKSDKEKIKKIIDQFQLYSDEIEIIMEKDRNKLQSMTSRTRALNDNENTIERQLGCLDDARVEIALTIEQLATAIV